MKEKQGEHPFGDAGQLIAFGLFAIVWIADSIFLNFSTGLTGYVPSYVRTIIAIVIFAVSLYLLAASHKVVAGENRPAKVISSGVFKYIRHPLYMSAILFYTGLIALTLSMISFALWIGIFIFYNYIAGYEEKLMEIKFGEEYLSYKQKTGKWLPRI
ncbi:MAG: isoprenylcysteine carboxylmethyltransferase family protein [Candidatus Zixiibacteriota bacterium]|nr:MAG: isoprenylcysteine carboxylmethyltransferase family protein [candidate division Zixibacteria bacterium]